MNFLAHLHLADGPAGAMLGGVAADFVRGPEARALPPDVQAGVQLHRDIDGFTDRHPVVHRSIAHISPALHWYSGIVIDVYYDFLLARGWARYSAEPLPAFIRRAYARLEERLDCVTGEARGFIRHLIDQDRLTAYGTEDGVAATLSRISDRIAARIPTRAVRLEAALPLLRAADDRLEAEFHLFYPDLMQFAATRRSGPGCASPPPG